MLSADPTPAALPAARTLLRQNPDIQGALLLHDRNRVAVLPLLLLPDDPARADYSEEQRAAASGFGATLISDDPLAANDLRAFTPGWRPVAVLVRTPDPAGQLYRIA